MRDSSSGGATLRARHWIITDALGNVEEVRGPGIVGQTPRIGPGRSHEYQSFSVLKTARGSMHGTFRMLRDDGEEFDAEVATFVLDTEDEDSHLALN